MRSTKDRALGLGSNNAKLPSESIESVKKSTSRCGLIRFDCDFSGRHDLLGFTDDSSKNSSMPNPAQNDNTNSPTSARRARRPL